MDSDNLYKFYGFAKRKIVPSLLYSQSIYEKVLDEKVAADINWLDVGCGHNLLPAWRAEEEKKILDKARHVVGFDYDFPSLLNHKNISQKVNGTADFLPFADNYFDVATANMVVEHFDNPLTQFAEINRILKPGGIFIFHTPNETGYFARMRKIVPEALVKKLAKVLDGRESEDVFHVHYKANREETIKYLARETNFEVEKIKLICSDAVFAIVPPLAVAELFLLRFLMSNSFRRWRTNMIVILKKKGGA